MKILSFILSAYLVLLIATPCCSFDNCPDGKMATEKKKAQDNDCCVCSPFFNCEGCATPSVKSEAILFSLVVLPGKKDYSPFISSLISEVHYDFWQPPRLG